MRWYEDAQTGQCCSESQNLAASPLLLMFDHHPAGVATATSIAFKDMTCPSSEFAINKARYECWVAMLGLMHIWYRQP